MRHSGGIVAPEMNPLTSPMTSCSMCAVASKRRSSGRVTSQASAESREAGSWIVRSAMTMESPCMRASPASCASVSSGSDRNALAAAISSSAARVIFGPDE